MSFDLDVTCWFILTQSGSSSNVKFIGQSSSSHEENAVTVVGATSSDGFLVATALQRVNGADLS